MAVEPDRRGWGRIRRLPSRKYQAAYVGPDARLHQAPATFSAHIDAEGWLAAERRLIELGDWTAPAARHLARYANTITVAEYVTQWIAERELARWTRISYESTLRTAIASSVIAPIAVKQLTSAQVTAWWRALPRDHPRARSKALALLTSAFNSAIEEELVETSPVKVRDPKAVTSSRPRPLTPPDSAQIDQLVEAMPERLRLAVLLAAWGGLRYGELAALRRSDLDLSGTYPVVRVARSVSFAPGQDVRVKTPKTAAGVRTVALPSWLKPLISQHLLAYAQAGDNGLVFASATAGFLWPSSFYRHWHRARELAGLPDLRVHDLRHHAAVRASQALAQAGESFSAVQARLGHSSARAALRYQHAASGSDLRIAEALDGMR
jgi:integrase